MLRDRRDPFGEARTLSAGHNLTTRDLFQDGSQSRYADTSLTIHQQWGRRKIQSFPSVASSLKDIEQSVKDDRPTVSCVSCRLTQANAPVQHVLSTQRNSVLIAVAKNSSAVAKPSDRMSLRWPNASFAFSLTRNRMPARPSRKSDKARIWRNRPVARAYESHPGFIKKERRTTGRLWKTEQSSIHEWEKEARKYFLQKLIN